ncbi:head completion/stabilization protein [Croceicoccus sp. BE223]|uniref:head completion/stabilization protein n=1 Tax=Croceicoccus sp. BE223 TaxID=2817716 RepID=UPI002856EEFC|nr:head completion/stabilization protein [Croceicoccus sp. BE223]MDR7101474.1 hypothetical protein [Croceicoccus sp. BE223]
MSLIANPPAPASPADSTVPADGWFPAISCNDMRDKIRVGKVVTHGRLTFAIEGALVTVMNELAAWQAAHVAAGAGDLAAIGAQAGKMEVLFRRAVYCTAAAELAETYRDISATDDGDARADEFVPVAADYRRMATHAIRDMIGTTRTAVELI